MPTSFFTKHYDRLMSPLEEGAFRGIRSRLLAKAQGEVLEIGSGTGANFAYYGREVRSVTALEPSDELRRASEGKAAQEQAVITLVSGDARQLPYEDQSFDTVVGTLVLCTIPEPKRAVEEVLRVLKPGGRLLFLEHVRMRQPVLGLLQDALTPVWKHLCDGCHLNRNPLALFAEAGVEARITETYLSDLFVSFEGEKAGSG